MKSMNKNEILQAVNQVSFMVDDITLYLDTHPDCKEAIDAYNHYKKLRCEAVDTYEELVGPLFDYEVNACQSWNWIEGPWPWEGVCGC